MTKNTSSRLKFDEVSVQIEDEEHCKKIDYLQTGKGVKDDNE